MVFKFPKAKFKKLGQDSLSLKAMATNRLYFCKKNSESSSKFGVQQ